MTLSWLSMLSLGCPNLEPVDVPFDAQLVFRVPFSGVVLIGKSKDTSSMRVKAQWFFGLAWSAYLEQYSTIGFGLHLFAAESVGFSPSSEVGSEGERVPEGCKEGLAGWGYHLFRLGQPNPGMIA